MTTDKIPTTTAIRLATSYHDAMHMVSARSTFGVGTRVNASPKKILDEYLWACRDAGVRLHNDAWEHHANIVVAELTEKRRKIWAEVFGPKKVEA